MAANGNLIFQDTNKAMFVGANSNVVIDTVNASFGVGVDVNGPTSNLHVVGNAYVTSNLEVGTANLFVDTVNSRVGVGTTNPQAPLHIGDYTTGSAGEILRLSGSSTSNRHFKFLNEDDGVIGGAGANAIWVHDINSSFGQYAFRTNNTELMRIRNDGNVGIGTTTPEYPFDVRKSVGDIEIRLEPGSDAQGNESGIRFDATFETTADNGHRRAADLRVGYNGGAWGTEYMSFRVGTGGQNDTQTLTTERMRIAGNGNVGIGTTTPEKKLHVEHSGSAIGDFEGIRIANHATLLHATVRPAYEFVVSDISSATGIGNGKFAIGYRATTSASRTDRLVIDNNGNVGIGTTTPQGQLHISSGTSGDCVLILQADTDNNNESDNPRIEFRQDGALIESAIAQGNNALQIKNGLDGITFWTGTSLSGSSDYITNTVERMRLDSGGNLGINDSTPGYKLDVNGTLRCFGFTNSSSDDRIKYNEQNVSNALTLISQLNPQKYEKIMERPNPIEGTWIPTDEEWENVKEDYTYGDEYGFIAQDVRAVPELSFLVTGEETRTDTKTSTPEEYSNLTTEEQSTYTISYLHGSNVVTQEEYSNLNPEEQGFYSTQYTKQFETQTPLGLNYQGLFVLAIGAIQELKAENEAIKARLDALENA